MWVAWVLFRTVRMSSGVACEQQVSMQWRASECLVVEITMLSVPLRTDIHLRSPPTSMSLDWQKTTKYAHICSPFYEIDYFFMCFPSVYQSDAPMWTMRDALSLLRFGLFKSFFFAALQFCYFFYVRFYCLFRWWDSFRIFWAVVRERTVSYK